MNRDKFDISFKSDIYKVNDVVNNSLEFLKYSYPMQNEANLMEFRLIFCELLFNAVIHGNNRDIKKKVYLSIKIRENLVSSIVSDEGIGFDYKKTIKNDCGEESIFLESGRGIKLVKALVDSLDFETNGSTVKFCKKVEFDG